MAEKSGSSEVSRQAMRYSANGESGSQNEDSSTV